MFQILEVNMLENKKSKRCYYFQRRQQRKLRHWKSWVNPTRFIYDANQNRLLERTARTKANNQSTGWITSQNEKAAWELENILLFSAFRLTYSCFQKKALAWTPVFYKALPAHESQAVFLRPQFLQCVILWHNCCVNWSALRIYWISRRSS